jgi:hypothetical protein
MLQYVFKGCINSTRYEKKGGMMLTFLLGIGIGTFIGIMLMAVLVSGKKEEEIRNQTVLNL